MEENKNACISINLSEGSITISGPEAFVEKNLNSAFEFVQRNRRTIPGEIMLAKREELGGNASFVSTPDSLPDKGTSVDDKYIKAGVYHIDSEDGTISILKKVPGNSKAEKVKNIALIVLYIRKGKIEGKELIPLCEKHACFDSSNFSAIFRNERTNFVRKGTGQSWTIELTQPGEVAALALLEDMASDKK